MKTLPRWVLAMLMVGMLPRTAGATVGGPTLCEVLGYQKATDRVYVHFLPQDAGTFFGAVMYFTISGAKPRELIQDNWPHAREGDATDPALKARLARLRPARVALLSFTGDRSEGGYGTQFPVLLWPGKKDRHVIPEDRVDR